MHSGPNDMLTHSSYLHKYFAISNNSTCKLTRLIQYTYKVDTPNAKCLLMVGIQEIMRIIKY